MPFSNRDSINLDNLMNGGRGSKVYPSLAGTPTFTSNATIWTLGNFTELVPSGAINKPFEVGYVSFAAVSVSTSYEFVLYAGEVGQEVEIGRVRFRTATSADAVLGLPIHSKILKAGTRISGKVASGQAGANTCLASIIYYTYD